MLRISKNPTFTHSVKAKVPVDGGYREDAFKATYRVLSPEALDAFALTTVAGTVDFLKVAIVRLDDLADEQEKPVPYSDELRDQALALPYVRVALIEGYYAGISGAAQGN